MSLNLLLTENINLINKKYGDRTQNLLLNTNESFQSGLNNWSIYDDYASVSFISDIFGKGNNSVKFKSTNYNYFYRPSTAVILNKNYVLGCSYICPFYNTVGYLYAKNATPTQKTYFKQSFTVSECLVYFTASLGTSLEIGVGADFSMDYIYFDDFFLISLP